MRVYAYNVWNETECEILIEWISNSNPPFMRRGKFGRIYLGIMNTPRLATIYSFFKLSELEKKKLCKQAGVEGL